MKAGVVVRRDGKRIAITAWVHEAERLWRSVGMRIEWDDGTVTRFTTVQHPALGTAGGV